MSTAVGRLQPMESPPTYFLAAHDLACCSEVDHRTAQDVVLMVVASSRCTVGEHTPPRPLTAGGV